MDGKEKENLIIKNSQSIFTKYTGKYHYESENQ